MKKGFVKRVIISTVLVAFVLALVMPAAQAAEYWKQKHVRFSATAGETLAVGDPVAIKASDSKAYKADANDSTLRPTVGVIGKGGSSGDTVEIVKTGVLGGQDEASPGARLFLSASPGKITSTAPGNPQVVGWVLPDTAATNTSTTYFIDVMLPTNSGAGY